MMALEIPSSGGLGAETPMSAMASIVHGSQPVRAYIDLLVWLASAEMPLQSPVPVAE